MCIVFNGITYSIYLPNGSCLHVIIRNDDDDDDDTRSLFCLGFGLWALFLTSHQIHKTGTELTKLELMLLLLALSSAVLSLYALLRKVTVTANNNNRHLFDHFEIYLSVFFFHLSFFIHREMFVCFLSFQLKFTLSRLYAYIFLLLNRSHCVLSVSFIRCVLYVCRF